MKEYYLEKESGHVVYFSEYGNPKGFPILSFHGGPGSKSSPQHAERFDLTKYRVILFDQRGCGKSTPLGEIENNTTEDTLTDVEMIREQLGIESWFVSGSSWGSTLSLLYAIAHTDRVKGILLSAVFLADRDTVAWAMEDPNGVARLVPDVWAKRMAFFAKFNIQIETQNEDILRVLEKASPEIQKEVTAGVQDWEDNLFSPQSEASYKDPRDVTEADIAGVRIFNHYEMNHAFIPEGYIFENIDKLINIPTVIVHGKYDILCPLQKALELKEALENCELIIATSSGHKFTAEGEPIRKLAFDRFLNRH